MASVQPTVPEPAPLARMQVIPRVDKYIRRSAHNQLSLSRYLAKSTVSEIQGMKATSLPWYSWDMGQKAYQAAELAEWLWWYSNTWARVRVTAGAGLQQMIPDVGISTQYHVA